MHLQRSAPIVQITGLSGYLQSFIHVFLCAESDYDLKMVEKWPDRGTHMGSKVKGQIWHKFDNVFHLIYFETLIFVEIPL